MSGVHDAAIEGSFLKDLDQDVVGAVKDVLFGHIGTPILRLGISLGIYGLLGFGRL